MLHSSGLVDGLNCGYAPGSWELAYCQDITTFQAYPGSMSKIVGAFINRPMSTPAGVRFQYTNENFMLLTYLVEKLSGVSYNEFLQRHVCRVIGLASTYHDPLEGSLKLADRKLSEGFRDYHDLTQPGDMDSSYFASALCSDEFNMGAFCGTGGMVSSAADMHRWYNELLVKRNPALLSEASIAALISPITLTSTRGTYNAYFGQGVGVDVRHGETLAYAVYYTGNLICSATSIRLLLATPADDPVLSVVFRNSVVVNASQAALSEAQLQAEGTFFEAAFVNNYWPSYGDSRVHAENLVNYFRANPAGPWSAGNSGGGDDAGLSGAALAGVVVAVAVIVLVVGFLVVSRNKLSKAPLAGGAAASDSKL